MQVSSILLNLFFIVCAACEVSCDYWTIREQFIKNEQSTQIGSKIKLTAKEKLVNKLLMQAKQNELQSGFEHPELFAPAKHFFQARKQILSSPVYKLIAMMPKGGALHVHDTSLSPTDYVLYNITYRENLYGCVRPNESLKLVFADGRPKDPCWKSVATMRNTAKSVKEFDDWLGSQLNIITDNPYEKFPDVNTVWKAFINLFGIVTPMITYRPVWEDYFYHSLKLFYDDNVNYLEIRGTLPQVYELNGTVYDPVEVIGILKKTAERFLKDYPDFIGIKYIFGPSRACNNVTMERHVKYMKELIAKYPDFVVGFDLVGQEDKGQPLVNFINELLELNNTKFFFHAGETKWNGMPTDLNLVDAVLLNTTRIGHGFALVKHSSVLQEIKKRGIGIEVNPISNQVLNLVQDLRNHPASVLFAQNYPVVVSSDDSGFWGAKPLSTDFYEAFMGIASASADLRMLKQLAYNSFLYSSLEAKDKLNAIKRFERKWQEFINDVVSTRSEPFSVRNI